MMKKGLIILVTVIGFFIIVGGSLIGSYNSLVTANENVQGKWSQVENQMQRRLDLIPNLVETVKGYAKHEEGVFNGNCRSPFQTCRSQID
jgi:LemA protein